MAFLNKIFSRIREREVSSYAKGLIFAMKTGIFRAKSQNPDVNFNELVKVTLSYRKDWEFLEDKDNASNFIYKKSEKIEIKSYDSFADVLCKIADVEIRNMYFKTIDKINPSVKGTGNLMLKGLAESEKIERIIRAEISKYSEEELEEEGEWEVTFFRGASQKQKKI